MLSTSGTSKPRIKEKLKFESALLTENVSSEVTALLVHELKRCIRHNYWPSAQDDAVIIGGERRIISFQVAKESSGTSVVKWVNIWTIDFFLSSQSSNVKGPEKRAENGLKVKNSKKEQAHNCESLFLSCCREETKVELLKSEF